MKSAKARRPYRMSARAQAAEATGEAILDATVALFWERPTDQLVLREVAERAGVTVQTVIRRFGSKDQLLEAAAERETGRTASQRKVAPGDVEGALTLLLEHYEQAGPGVLRLLALEGSSAVLADYAERGRRLHRDWCAETFEPMLRALAAGERERRLAQLAAVTDLGTWKVLRLDCGLDRHQTRTAVRELLAPLAPSPQENR